MDYGPTGTLKSKRGSNNLLYSLMIASFSLFLMLQSYWCRQDSSPEKTAFSKYHLVLTAVASLWGKSFIVWHYFEYFDSLVYYQIFIDFDVNVLKF